MKNKITYYKKNNFNVIRKLTLISLSLLISVTICFHMSAKLLYPTFLNYAKMQTNKLSTALVNKAIQSTILNDLKQDEIIKVNYQDNGIASSVEFNTYTINKITMKAASSVYSNLKYIEEGNIEQIEYDKLGLELDNSLLSKGIIYEIPYGMAFHNGLLANFGPKLPVRFTILGEILSFIESRVSQYGINNALIEVVATLTIKMLVVIPLATTTSETNYEIPIAIKVIAGMVPTYFQGNNTIDDNFVIPLK